MDFIIPTIFIDKTIEQFGEIINRDSSVIVECVHCHNEFRMVVRKIKDHIRFSKNIYCAKCSNYIRNLDPDYKKKESLISKRIWDDPNVRKKHKTIIRRLWDDPIYREKKSKISKNLWQKSEYKQKLEKAHNINFRRKQSKYSKKLWNNEDYRTKVINSVQSNECKEKIKQSKSILFKDPNFKQKMSEISKEIWLRPGFRENQSKTHKLLWKNNNYIEKQKITRSSIEFKNKLAISLSKIPKINTKIEINTQRILDSLDIKYDIQCIIGPYTFDLFIPTHNLLVECQGEYWHSPNKVKQKDAAKFTYIDKYFPQYRILYLYERDFLNPGIVKQKLIRELFNESNTINQINFSFKNLEIKKLSIKNKNDNSYYSIPEEFLQSFHYAGFGRNSKFIYGAYLQDKLIAICKFSTPIRKEVATSLGYQFKEVLELDRFCIHPQYQKKNFASWFISKCSKLIDSNIKCLVSFADTTYGHLGTIYKAANWNEIGLIKPDYYYINNEGWVIHKKTLYNHAVKMGKKETEYAVEFGYKKIFGKEKIKFIMNRNV